LPKLKFAILAIMKRAQGEHPSIDRCDPATDKEALALAAQAWPQAERAGYWQAIRSLVSHGDGQRAVLLAIRNAHRLLAAQVAQVLPGNVAIVWSPQFETPIASEQLQLAAALFARMNHELKQGGAQMAQSLVSASDEATARSFLIGGFSKAADLLYLAAEVNDAAEPPALPFELEAFTPQHEKRWLQLIDRTYAGTLDCPLIDGLRKTEDVFAGYQAVGEFRPELWQIAVMNGVDVGCLLVNLHPDVGHAEIVYVAIVPEVRGRGWGLALTRHAQWLARQTKSQRLVLAVDAANEPAIRLYSKAGFDVFDRRAVWIRSLREIPNSL
jgi:ribosomal protein S18 acetylase RimI-like enzyme